MWLCFQGPGETSSWGWRHYMCAAHIHTGYVTESSREQEKFTAHRLQKMNHKEKTFSVFYNRHHCRIYLLPRILLSKHMEVGVLIIFVPFQTSLFSMKPVRGWKCQAEWWKQSLLRVSAPPTHKTHRKTHFKLDANAVESEEKLNCHHCKIP